jgi:holliday junction DNA helicase RuvB
MTKEKVVTFSLLPQEEEVASTSPFSGDLSFRDYSPRSFSDYVGQQKLQEKLHIYTQAAKFRTEPLDHVLLFGAPGLGKTTLAHIIAHEMNAVIKLCSGPILQRSGDLVAILSGLAYGDILFIDEIHRLDASLEEILYTAMEEFRIDVIIGQGVGAKSVSLPLQPFTLIGATTMSGKISAPLRSRFSIIEQMEPYSDTDLQKIILQSAKALSCSISDEGALTLAAASRSTPRIAKKLLRRVRDFAQMQQRDISKELVLTVLEQLGITQEGLTKQELTLIHAIVHSFSGGPVGLETLAAILQEDAETIERVYEPFLMQKGYLEKTSRGRQIPRKMLDIIRNQQTIV